MEDAVRPTCIIVESDVVLPPPRQLVGDATSDWTRQPTVPILGAVLPYTCTKVLLCCLRPLPRFNYIDLIYGSDANFSKCPKQSRDMRLKRLRKVLKVAYLRVNPFFCARCLCTVAKHVSVSILKFSRKKGIRARSIFKKQNQILLIILKPGKRCFVCVKRMPNVFVMYLSVAVKLCFSFCVYTHQAQRNFSESLEAFRFLFHKTIYFVRLRDSLS